MVREAAYDAVYQVAEQWRDRCLLDDKSLLWPDEVTWTVENIRTASSLLNELAVKKRATVKDIASVLSDQVMAVRRVVADATAFWTLFLGEVRVETREEQISQVASWGGPGSDLAAILRAATENIAGRESLLIRPGFQMRRVEHILFFLEFAGNLKTGRIDPVDFAATRQIADETRNQVPRSQSAFTMILHALFPEHVEAIFNHWLKTKLAEAEAFLYVTPNDNEDVRIAAIRKEIARTIGRSDFSFLDDEILRYWNPIKGSEIKRFPASALVNPRRQYWKIAPGENAKHWAWFKDDGLIAVSWSGSPDLRTLGPDKAAFVEQLKQHPSLQEKGHNLGYWGEQLWMFANEMRVGDVVVAYGDARVHGWGVITGDYRYEQRPDGRYQHQRAVEWRSQDAVPLDRLPAELQKKLTQNVTLAKLTASEFAIIRDGGPVPDPTTSLAELLHLDQAQLDEIADLLRSKRQIILEGPPGSGKTYLADLLARSLTGNPLTGAHDERIEIVQFHQSYGYEDFVQGIRPLTDEQGRLHYRVVPGIFLQFCERARANPGETFVLIIDEINRGNLSRIFGELLMLLEYRERRVRLPYASGDEPAYLQIPANLLLIGTMNSTDRSLAMMDYALRRRFAFYRLQPVVDGRAPVLERWLAAQPFSPSDRRRVLDYFVALNERVSEQLTPDFQIGHSYLMDPAIDRPETLARVWRYGLRPLLEEYFHASRAKRQEIEALAPDVVAGSAPEAEPAVMAEVAPEP